MSIGRHICKLAGYAPTLPTPFTENDAIDAAVFERFCELQISNGVTALVVGGTTGEAPNLIRDEHCKLVRIATGVSRGRVPIVAGAGSNSTQHAIELTKDAEAWLSHGSVDDTQRDDSSSGFTKWLNFTSAIEESRRIREWLLGILRFAVTLEQCDRAAVMYLAAEMDRFGSSTTQSRFSYFTRTSAKLCDCIIAKRDFDNLAQLRFHIKKIDDQRLRRALEGVLFEKHIEPAHSRKLDHKYLWNRGEIVTLFTGQMRPISVELYSDG